MRSSTTIDISRRSNYTINEKKVQILKAIKSNTLIDVNIGSRILLDREPSNLNKICRRCTITGRAKGNYRRFKMCRIKVRENALLGNLSCIRKMTWLLQK